MIQMKEIVSICKNRGFIFAGSEIYGGLANTWDYGPMGVELKNNIKKAWWQKFVYEQEYNVGIDAAILMNPKTWQASGHLSGFSDPLVDCKNCKMRYRADHLIENFDSNIEVEKMVEQELNNFISDNDIKCPNCKKKDFTSIRNFNLMFKTFQGVTEDSSTQLYLRPETAQSIFVDFKLIQRSSRKQIPFGVCQVGKSFRNEITPGNFIFRTREFEQMELEFFTHPDEASKWYDYWKKYCFDFLVDLGIEKDNLRFRDHSKEELSHYSLATSDIEFMYPFGWGELWGIANRTDYDLSSHMRESTKDLTYQDPMTNEKYIPYVIEPSVGVDRMLLAFLTDAFKEEQLEDGTKRTVLKLHPKLAPVKIAVLPLTKKLSEKAYEVYNSLKLNFNCEIDEKANIGKRYRRFDEIGTPYCVTIDFDTLEDNTVTIRHRDTMDQIRMDISELNKYFIEKLLLW